MPFSTTAMTSMVLGLLVSVRAGRKQRRGRGRLTGTASKAPRTSAMAAAAAAPAMGAAVQAAVLAASREAVLDRIGGAMWGLFIGDALAMPTHWFYGGERQVISTYGGPITGYVKPSMQLPGSIMNLSSTGGGGRGSDSGQIVGNIINHGKKQYWTAQGSYHYHCTLDAGENTLEAQLVRLVARGIVQDGGKFVPASMCQRYIEFMTTPGSHNDCYASTCHRMFFANLQKGLAPDQCPDNDNHNVDTVDGLAMTVPVALAMAGQQMPQREVRKQVAACSSVTRKSSDLEVHVGKYSDILGHVISGVPLTDAMRNCGERFSPQGRDQVVS